ncbi:ParA family protein [Paenibacillus sp. V4I7]|uniref:ParA family protein n=1 Tax=Paenibacillus sp. V4I7 TaxID=3042307 RepID=UPI002787BAFE|nr:AAA family ATPase [Paenibacillus sp. V4I7]MDQ0902750.1 chromosome partitioning protein [Paenibacillus sp. V4I7]
MGKVISVINWKGGVGKTTITHHIAVGLQKLDHSKDLGLDNAPRVLLLDADAQCNLSIACLGDNQFEDLTYKRDTPIPTIKDIFEQYLDNGAFNIENKIILKEKVRSREPNYIFKYIDLVPSHPDLIYTDMFIAQHDSKPKPKIKPNLLQTDVYKFQILDTILESVRDKYDYILIDCPPNLNYITQNALYASDYYLIPTIADKLSSYGIMAVSNAVNNLNNNFVAVSQDYNETKLLGIVLNNIREYRRKPKKSQFNIMQSLQQLFKNDVFSQYLTYGDGIPRASAMAYPVFALEDKLANAKRQSDFLREISIEFVQRCR